MEIAVISGKGGTGKSSIAAAFATINKNVVLADCDVDAANQYLIFQPEKRIEKTYISGFTALIDYNKCTSCGTCIDYCRFDAISLIDDKVLIDNVSCDGCKLCSRICPAEAIEMIQDDKSRLYAGTFRNGQMVYGRLSPGEENSGKLVDMVRDEAKNIQKEFGLNDIILDGPPGIGCPVISTITGVDRIVIVTEPTLSGLHDLKRTLEMVQKFRIRTFVIINKSDLNKLMTEQIEQYCTEKNIIVVGKIPFDSLFTEAMVECLSIIEKAPNSPISLLIISSFNYIKSN